MTFLYSRKRADKLVADAGHSTVSKGFAGLGALTLSVSVVAIMAAGSAHAACVVIPASNFDCDLGGGAAINGDVTIEEDSTLVVATENGDGDFSISGDLNNFGTVDMSRGRPGAAGDTLTVGADYTAQSKLLMDAALNETETADTLVVIGDIDGQTEITIFDTAPGDLPSWTGLGQGSGIVLVDNSIGMDVVEGDFILDVEAHPNDEIVKAPFAYMLSTQSDGIVYLQSEVLGQIYGYAILAELMRDEFPTLRERLGNERFGAMASGGASAAENQVGVWARIDVMSRESDAANAETDPFNDHDWEQMRGEVAVGLDMPVLVGGGTVLLGASGHAVYTTADAHGRMRGGADVEALGLGLGVEAAFFAGGGFYMDLQGRVSFWDTDVDYKPLRVRDITESVDATSWGLSLEAGSRIGLGSSMAAIPRVQMVYTDVDFDGFTDSDGVVVKQKDSDSLVLSAGVTVEAAVLKSGVSLYGDLSASWDALSDSSIEASQFEFKSGLEDVWGNLAVGVSMQLGSDVSAYLQGEVGSAIDEQFRNSTTYGATVGIRFDF